MRVRLAVADPAEAREVRQRLAFHLHDLEAHLQSLEIVVDPPTGDHGPRLRVCLIRGHCDDQILFELCERQSRLDLALSRALERGARLCRRRLGRLRRLG